jgi:hypothetical protein
MHPALTEADKLEQAWAAARRRSLAEEKAAILAGVLVRVDTLGEVVTVTDDLIAEAVEILRSADTEGRA